MASISASMISHFILYLSSVELFSLLEAKCIHELVLDAGAGERRKGE
jgi:hypothetical protein